MTHCYLNGDYLPLDRARISPMDRGFLYGDAVYEVIRVYRGRIFLLEAHFGRLEASLARMRMGAYLTPLHEVPRQLLARNDLRDADALVYVQVSRGTSAARHHYFPPPDTPPTIFAYAWAYTPSPAMLDPGVTVITVSDDRWARCDIKTTALVPNVLANQRAREAGAQEAIFVRDGALTEGTHSNIWAVVDGEVRTPPLTNYILMGITRMALLEVCRTAGIPVRETPIFQHELADADELFITSTVSDVAPVARIDGRVMPRERPVTDRLVRLFAERVARDAV